MEPNNYNSSGVMDAPPVLNPEDQVKAFEADFGAPTQQQPMDDFPPPPPPTEEEIAAAQGDQQAAGDPVFPGMGGSEEQARAESQSRRMALPLETVLRIRGKLQAQLFKMISKSDSTEQWEYSEEDMDLLLLAWSPYEDVVKNGIPPIVVLLGTEMFLLGKKIMAAINERKVNTRNEAQRSAPEVMQEMASGAAQESSIERRHFKIDENGYYVYRPGGRGSEYRLRAEDRTEKADLKDIAKMVPDNAPKSLQKVFGITDAQLAQYSPAE